LVVVLLGALAVSTGSALAVGRSDGSAPAPAQITQLVTHVPAGALNKVGTGKLSGPPVFNVFKLAGAPLTAHGKPELLSETLAWCPHCAATSWALAIALSRFGTLSGLREIDSGTYYCQLTADPCGLKPQSCFPHTKGLSFLDTKLRSRYLVFKDIVFQSVSGRNLQKPSGKENAAINTFDRQGQTPAIDVGGDFAFLNSGFSPGALHGESWLQIASSLAHPRNRTARHIDGLANLFAAAICRVTKGRPASVCRSRGVREAGAARLAHAAPPPPPPPPPPQ
jgi:hypothetical protein